MFSPFCYRGNQHCIFACYLPDFYVIFLLFSERGLIPRLNSKIFSWTPWAVGHPKAVGIQTGAIGIGRICSWVVIVLSPTPEHENAVWSKNQKNIFAYFGVVTFSLFTHPWTSEWRLAENPGKYFHNLFRSLFLPLTPTPADECAIWTKIRKSFLDRYWIYLPPDINLPFGALKFRPGWRSMEVISKTFLQDDFFKKTALKGVLRKDLHRPAPYALRIYRYCTYQEECQSPAIC